MINYSSFRISASGMSAERLRMDVISANIANADSTRSDDGGPYARQRVIFQATSDRTRSSLLNWGSGSRLSGRNSDVRGSAVIARWHPLSHAKGVQVAEVTADTQPFPSVYDPQHPDADAQGYVRKSNVNVVTEMTDMIGATRAYEANVTAFNAAKSMFSKALEIGS